MSAANNKLSEDKQWLLKLPDDSRHGPVSLHVLREWATQNRILPGSVVSVDGRDWVPAETIAALKMDWTTEREDGSIVGPFNIFAVPAMVASGALRREARLLNKSGKTVSVSELIGSSAKPVKQPPPGPLSPDLLHLATTHEVIPPSPSADEKVDPVSPPEKTPQPEQSPTAKKGPPTPELEQLRRKLVEAQRTQETMEELFRRKDEELQGWVRKLSGHDELVRTKEKTELRLAEVIQEKNNLTARHAAEAELLDQGHQRQNELDAMVSRQTIELDAARSRWTAFEKDNNDLRRELEQAKARALAVEETLNERWSRTETELTRRNEQVRSLEQRLDGGVRTAAETQSAISAREATIRQDLERLKIELGSEQQELKAEQARSRFLKEEGERNARKAETRAGELQEKLRQASLALERALRELEEFRLKAARVPEGGVAVPPVRDRAGERESLRNPEPPWTARQDVLPRHPQLDEQRRQNEDELASLLAREGDIPRSYANRFVQGWNQPPVRLGIGIALVLFCFFLVYQLGPGYARRKLIRPRAGLSEDLSRLRADGAEPTPGTRKPTAAVHANLSWPAINLDRVLVGREEGAATIVFDMALFSTRTNLAAQASLTLEELATQLKGKLKDFDMVIEGHTDTAPVGSDNQYSDNIGLGQMRADMVLSLFRDRCGLTAGSMTASSAGENNPPFSNETDASRRKNRTVVIRLTPR